MIAALKQPLYDGYLCLLHFTKFNFLSKQVRKKEPEFRLVCNDLPCGSLQRKHL